MSIWTDKPNIERWIRETCEMNGVSEFAQKIKYQFSNRFLSRLGDANNTSKMLRFSAVLWKKATDADKENTVKHECAHLIAWEKFGKVPSHGKEWASVMIRAGQEPTRCHSIQTAKKTVDVICTGCKQIIKMGVRRAAKMKQGQNYLCRGCGCRVEFIK